MAFDIRKAAGLGTDTIDRSVLGMPFLNIIQKGSPEFDETHKDYSRKKIEGCRPGNILFEPERLILKQPLSVIPLAQTTHYTAWKPNKGGFAGNLPLTITQDRAYRRGQKGTKAEFKEYLGELELIYTMLFAVLFKDGDEWRKGLIAFTGTQLKHARDWTKTIFGLKYEDTPDIKPPIFAAVYSVTTEPENNKEGGWFGWKIEPEHILCPEADQTLLETAFTACNEAKLALPKPEETPQLTNGAANDAAIEVM